LRGVREGPWGSRERPDRKERNLCQPGDLRRPGPVKRLQEYLRSDELDVVRGLQNAVIQKLSPPPHEHIEALRAAFAKTAQDPDGLVEALLADFRPLAKPYRFKPGLQPAILATPNRAFIPEARASQLVRLSN
jgi:hypothetical protein